MARINISIPDELKEKMDKWVNENWSSVAQDEFNRHIKLLEIKEVDMTEAQLERLRQSRDKHYQKSHAEGVELGKEWALNSADFDEIERVVDMANGINAVIDAGGEINFISELTEALQYGDAEIEEIFGTRTPSDEAIEGFIEGVLEIKDAI